MRGSAEDPAFGAVTATRTFLFTDIEASTRQWEAAPGMRDRVDGQFAALRAAVESKGGEVFATMGDGIAAAFASADAAVHAAVTAQREMPAIDLRVRLGLHTGEVDRVDDDFRGRPVNRAARIMQAGCGGQILLSDVTAALVRSGSARVELVDLGRHGLRDLSEPERLWQVVDAGLEQRFPPVRSLDGDVTSLPAPRSSLIGRASDVREVVDLVGAHRLVTLTGVGGVGKTRLGLQVAAELDAVFSTVWLVELASVTRPDDITDAIAMTIVGRAAADPLAATVSLVGREQALLVLDNCEHLVDAAAVLVDELLHSGPQLHIVTTSREALGVDGERGAVQCPAPRSGPVVPRSDLRRPGPGPRGAPARRAPEGDGAAEAVRRLRCDQ